MINIGIIEDNYFQLTNYKEFLEDFQECKIVFGCRSVEEFEALRFIEPAHVVLLDITLPGASGIEGISIIKDRLPDTKVVMLSAHMERHFVINSIRNGAVGYIVKTARMREIYQCILDVLDYGGVLSPSIAQYFIGYINDDPLANLKNKLTKREYELVSLLKEGYSYQVMAEKLNISTFTVNHHLKKIYPKLKVSSKSELVSRICLNHF